jgi:hypothetical protein
MGSPHHYDKKKLRGWKKGGEGKFGMDKVIIYFTLL